MEHEYSEQYVIWQQGFKNPILKDVEHAHLQDLSEFRQMQRELLSTRVEEVAPAAKSHGFLECRNCFVRFIPEQRFIELFSNFCSPNCALRANLDAYNSGEMSGRIHQHIVEKIEDFFGLAEIEPFPPFEQFRGSAEEYHRQRPMPPGYEIQYYDRRQETSQPRRSPQGDFNDPMELN